MNVQEQTRKGTLGKKLIVIGIVYNVTCMILLMNNKEIIRHPIFLIGSIIGIILTGTGAALKEPHQKKNIAMAITAILIVYLVTQIVNLSKIDSGI